MSTVSNFSFRQNSRTLVLRSIEEHHWEYDVQTLSHMLNNYPVYVEMGGLLGIAYSLRTDTNGGLREDERLLNFDKRTELYGLNTLPLPPVRSLWLHALDALQDVMLLILIVGGVVSIIANTIRHPQDGWIEGLAILIAVVIVVLVSSLNNHSQERAFLKLASSLKGSRVTCVRGGVSCLVEQDDILVGDIISLNPGNMIPADGVMIDQTTIRVNESALTGEADECVKTPSWPFLSAGTELVDGSCVMLVTAVGSNSAKGKIMSSLAQEQEQTKLQKRLEHTATMVGYVGMAFAICTFLALIIRWVIRIENDATLTYSEEWNSIIDYFIISITIIVVAIPEGLPLAVTISLAYSMAKMRVDQNLVKVLSACETMGNATTICSDKTGTLTQNKMTVVQMYVGSVFYPRQAQVEEIHEKIHPLLIHGIICNSDRRVTPENMDFKVAPEDWKWEGDGGATESALLAWLSRYHEPPAKTIMDLRSSNREKIMQFYPFSSAKKVSSVIVTPENSTDLTNCRRYYKGAADRVIRQCTSMVDKNGDVVKVGNLKLRPCTSENCKRDAMRGESADNLTLCEEHSTLDLPFDGVCRHTKHGETCNKWAVMGEENGTPMYCTDPNHHPANKQMFLLDQHPMKLMSNMTRVGLRCIAFGYVDNVVAEIKDGQFVDPAEVGDWTLIGLVGIKDPLRLETRDAIMTVQQAGIIVRMVTGDNLDTARFISKDCGIVSHSRHLAMEGVDFRMALEANEQYKAKNNEDNPEFVELVTNLRVMARCQPEDKLELVKFLKEHDQVVGVTGDGSNDGPALKIAHVGLAMGIAGTDVAKAAADIIILDDNFSSIVKSVMWGRCVYDNIRKFLQFQCAVNLCALILAFVGAVVDGKEPLKPVQLLWVNLIMDTMGALALGTENPKPTLLQRKPFKPTGALISPLMWRNIVGQGLFQLAVLFIILYTGKSWLSDRFAPFLPDGTLGYNEKKHFTFIFNTFVWLQFFNEVNSRKVNDEKNIMEGFFENAWFSSILAITAFFQVLMVEVFGSFASTTHQEWDLWLIAIALGFVMIPSGLFLRYCIPISPNHGQIDIDDNTFENAPWIDDPSLTGALFRKEHTSAAKTEDEHVGKVVPNHYEPPSTTTGLLVQCYE